MMIMAKNPEHSYRASRVSPCLDTDLDSFVLTFLLIVLGSLFSTFKGYCGHVRADVCRRCALST